MNSNLRRFTLDTSDDAPAEFAAVMAKWGSRQQVAHGINLLERIDAKLARLLDALERERAARSGFGVFGVRFQ